MKIRISQNDTMTGEDTLSDYEVKEFTLDEIARVLSEEACTKYEPEHMIIQDRIGAFILKAPDYLIVGIAYQDFMEF